ncbi:hypothetical protein PLICRDRAFT_48646 [Plicaturopsis crispa FD-325 SS-3]|nr:hypothetical protein PLICRDRAFT_48646 [Plicaturopsis crispa FD-325 SS-3]
MLYTVLGFALTCHSTPRRHDTLNAGKKYLCCTPVFFESWMMFYSSRPPFLSATHVKSVKRGTHTVSQATALSAVTISGHSMTRHFNRKKSH